MLRTDRNGTSWFNYNEATISVTSEEKWFVTRVSQYSLPIGTNFLKHSDNRVPCLATNAIMRQTSRNFPCDIDAYQKDSHTASNIAPILPDNIEEREQVRASHI